MEIIHKMYSLHLWTARGQWCVYSQGIDALFLAFKGSRAVRIFRIDVMPDRSALQTEITRQIIKFQRLWRRHWRHMRAIQSIKKYVFRRQYTGENLFRMYQSSLMRQT